MFASKSKRKIHFMLLVGERGWGGGGVRGNLEQEREREKYFI